MHVMSSGAEIINIRCVCFWKGVIKIKCCGGLTLRDKIHDQPNFRDKALRTFNISNFRQDFRWHFEKFRQVLIESHASGCSYFKCHNVSLNNSFAKLRYPICKYEIINVRIDFCIFDFVLILSCRWSKICWEFVWRFLFWMIIKIQSAER